MSIFCLFCEKDVTDDEPDFKPTRTLYMCKRCGLVQLEEEAADDFAAEQYSANDKATISITLRNEWERSGRRSSQNHKLTLGDLNLMVFQFRHLDAIDKMDYVLTTLDKSSKFVGDMITVNYGFDYPLYYCKEPKEMLAILKFLLKEGFISAPDVANPQSNLNITAKGYQRIREINKSNLCPSRNV